MSAPTTTTTVAEENKGLSKKTKLWIIGLSILFIPLLIWLFTAPEAYVTKKVAGQIVIELNKGDEWKEVTIPPQHRIELSATKNAVIDVRINHNPGNPKTIGPGRGYVEFGPDVENLEFQMQTDQTLDTAEVGYKFERLKSKN